MLTTKVILRAIGSRQQKKVAMKNIFYLFLFASFEALAQGPIGIPIFDKNIKLGSCPVCEIKLAPQDKVHGRLGQRLTEIDSDIDVAISRHDEIDTTLFLKHINFLNSLISSAELSDSVKALLLLRKIQIYQRVIVEKDQEVYNYYLTLSETNNNLKGALFMTALYDQLIALNVDPKSHAYFLALKADYYTRTYLIYHIDDYGDEWLREANLELLHSTASPEQQQLAEDFLHLRKQTPHNPFYSFNALSFGYSASSGKGLWHGPTVSFDYGLADRNPFRRKDTFFGIDTDTRGSLASLKLLRNITDQRTDLILNVAEIKNLSHLQVNIYQFGWHLTEPKALFFYRPEIGLSYGCFTLSYAYNVTFDKSFRPNTDKSMLTLSISYPFLRLGRYY